MDTQVSSEKWEENTQENKARAGMEASFQLLKSTSPHLQLEIYLL